MGGADRPRNIMLGSSRKHGAATYLQFIMHQGLRKHVPGYIQGYTKDELVTKLNDNVNSDMKSYSIDGSAFESTQHVSIMKIVDDAVYEIFYRLFLRTFPHNVFFQTHVTDLSAFLTSWFKDATNHTNYMFICLPGIKSTMLASHIKIFK